jgi:ferredoxin
MRYCLKTDIHYFSGTGNTLYAASHLAHRLGAMLKPIASLANEYAIETDADAIGIVFPVYYGDLPVIVKKFLGLLENVKGKYIFAIATYGGAAGTSFKTISRILESKGGILSASYGIHMPQNAFHKSWENNNVTLNKAIRKIERIADEVTDKKTGKHYPGVFMKPILYLMHETFKPLYKKGMLKYSNAAPETGFDTLVHLADKSFTVSDACNECGLCAKVCPVDNIDIAKGRPIWLNRCENCLACYDWCPKSAILGGVSMKGYHYRNNRIRVADIINQKYKA